MDISKVLDDAKQALKVDTDYKLAKHLEISNGYIAQWRKGTRIPDAYACARLAEILKMDPFELLVQVEAATEKNEGRRAYWKKVAERMAGASLAAFFVLAALPETSKAEQNTVKDQELTVFRSMKHALVPKAASAPMCQPC
ncbi:MAG: hypothetical protein JSS57_16595 [Proteobacteria bacterium]|nr:hypothetical protein [Pseudomonadota bacterium]